MNGTTANDAFPTHETAPRRGSDPLFVLLAGTAGAVLLAITAVLFVAAGAAGLLIAGGATGAVALTGWAGDRFGQAVPLA